MNNKLFFRSFFQIAICIPIICFFFSCKEENLDSPTPDSFDESQTLNEDSNSFFIHINIGGVDNTRAGNENYENYENNENTIVSGRIYVLEESADKKEENAKCVTFGILLEPASTQDYTEGIISKTARYKNVELQDFEYDENKNYYALVILNPTSDFTPIYIGDTFGSWAYNSQSSNMVSSVSDYYSGVPLKYKFITMTNATGHINRGSDSFNPTTLVPIHKGDIKRGKFPENHVSNTTIWVQRNVAKVIVKSKVNEENNREELSSTEKFIDIGDAHVQFNLSVWYLDVINTESYPVQKIKRPFWNKNYFHSNQASSFDQVYWAIDPNYDDKTKTKKSNNFTSSVKPVNAALGDPLYCLENTFDIDNMLQGQTTRAIIRCQLEWWGTDAKKERLTDIRLPEDDYFWDSTGKTAKVKSDVVGNDFEENGFYIIGSGENVKLSDFSHLNKILTKKAKEILKEDCDIKLKDQFFHDVQNTNNHLNAGYYALKDLVDIKIHDEIVSLTNENWDILARAIGLEDGTNDKIGFYYNCWAYYVVRIRHFSDEEGADWDGSFIRRESDNGKIAKYEDKHLGRYGVVRNNLYEIVVKSIKSLGSPEPFPDINNEDTDDMPDDYFIDVSINVKNWNKRQNSFDLM